MSDIISLYEDNLNKVIDNLKKICVSFLTYSRDKKESAITAGTDLLQKGEKIISQIDLEISTKSETYEKNMLINKLQNQKYEFYNLKEKYLKIQNEYIQKKAENAVVYCSEDGSDNQNKDTQINPVINEQVLVGETESENKEKSIVKTFEKNVKVEVEKNNNENDFVEDNDFNIKVKKGFKYTKITIILVFIVLLIIVSGVLILIKFKD